MKKLVLILTAVAVLVAFAVPALASDASWAGEFTFGGITPFEHSEVNNGYGNLYADVTYSVDDYNDVVFEFGGGFGNASSVAGAGAAAVISPVNAWTIGAAFLQTSVGDYLGLAIPLTAKAGFASLYSSKYEVSGHAWERTPVRSNIAGHGFYFNADFGMAIVDFGFNMEAGGTDAAPQIDYGVLVTLPEVGPAFAEAFYMINDNHEFKGAFGVDGNASFGPAKAAAGFKYDTLMETWAFGVGGAYSVSIATLGVSLNGNDVDAINMLGIDVNIAPSDMYGADVAVGLGLAENAETFQGLEVSAYLAPGASKWRAGYLVTDQGYAYASQATSFAEPLGGGGLFLACDIDF